MTLKSGAMAAALLMAHASGQAAIADASGQAVATNFGTRLTSAWGSTGSASFVTYPGIGGSATSAPLDATQTGVLVTAHQAGTSRFTGATITSDVSVRADLHSAAITTALVGQEEMAGQLQGGLSDELYFTNAGGNARLRVTTDFSGPTLASLTGLSWRIGSFVVVGNDYFQTDWLYVDAQPANFWGNDATTRNVTLLRTGDFDYRFAFEMLLPTGFTSTNFRAGINVLCSGAPGADCALGNSVATRFEVSRSDIVAESASGAIAFGQFDAAPEPPPPPGVPEPASWAMLIAGFALLGGALRRRRTAAA